MFAKVKKELPEYLIIAALLWAVKIAAYFKGFYPITWAVCILTTALIMYFVTTVEGAAHESLQSSIKRIRAK